MAKFKPGDKVLHKSAKDASNVGVVMSILPMQRHEGMVAVYFRRQVWIKPESLVSLEQWKQKHSEPVQAENLRDYWK
jgi:hypothetical protein